MLIEGLRTDSLYIGVFRISQVVGFFCFVLGAIALIVLFMKANRREMDNEEYVLAYKKVSRPQSFFEENAEAAAENNNSISEEVADNSDDSNGKGE